MKKIVAVLLALTMCIVCGICAYAEASVCAIGSAKKECSLIIASTTATCKSTYVDTAGSTSKVVITQTLQKQGLLWTWSTYNSNVWTKTTNGSSVSLSKKVYSLESGTYRVMTTFNVTSTDGSTETITIYSSEKTVD